MTVGGDRMAAGNDANGPRRRQPQVSDSLLEGDLRDPAFAARASAGRGAVLHPAGHHAGRASIESHRVDCVGNIGLDVTALDRSVKAGAEIERNWVIVSVGVIRSGTLVGLGTLGRQVGLVFDHDDHGLVPSR